MVGMAWAAIGFRAATLGSLVAALSGLRAEIREGFRAQGERIDALAVPVDAHVDRHAG
jgi:hypothetical protein